MFFMLGLFVNFYEMIEVVVVVLFIGVFMIVIGWLLSVFFCFLLFRKIILKFCLFVLWVGLWGVVFIIFVIYLVVVNVEGLNMIFNIVFFIMIVLLIV